MNHDSQPANRAVVRVLHTPGAGAEQVHAFSGAIVVGRQASRCDLVLDDADVSRRHLEIKCARGRFTVADLESRNGTFLDGAALRPPTDTRLPDEAVLRLGESVLLFRRGTAEAPAEPDEIHALLPGRSPVIVELRRLARRVAQLDGTVLVTGETGTGKEYLSKAMHTQGPRRRGPFVAVNCGELRPELQRAELFGTTDSAYTGARATDGLVASAEGGTLFLDEVGELRREAQVELLRFLQDRTYRAVGSRTLRRADVRIVAATNADLDSAVAHSVFRSDLLARLRAEAPELRIPPLRDRREDITLWLRTFMTDIEASVGRSLDWTTGFVECLAIYDWPSNLRELSGALWTAVLCAEPRTTLTARDLPAVVNAARRQARTRVEPEEEEADGGVTPEELEAALRCENGVLTRVSRRLGVHRRKVYRLLEDYGLDAEAFRDGDASATQRKPKP